MKNFRIKTYTMDLMDIQSCSACAQSFSPIASYLEKRVSISMPWSCSSPNSDQNFQRFSAQAELHSLDVLQNMNFSKCAHSTLLTSTLRSQLDISPYRWCVGSNASNVRQYDVYSGVHLIFCTSFASLFSLLAPPLFLRLISLIRSDEMVVNRRNLITIVSTFQRYT